MSTASKAAVFLLLGQSNAVGHGLPMRKEDRIETPLNNVFGLRRDPNQSYRSTKLVWSGYTSGGMNLAEEQDHTYSVVNCLAALWQDAVDKGASLPDLYLVQIAIGSQGVTEGYMWHPDRPPKLIPGALGTVDLSLFPFCEHIFTLLKEDFQTRNQDYEIIGLHWRGGENDVSASPEYLSACLEGIYRRILDRFNELLDFPPTVFHRLVCPDCMMEMDPTGQRLKNMEYINTVFQRLQDGYPNVTLLDPRTAPYFCPDKKGHGMFLEDHGHFTEAMNRWIAEGVLHRYRKGL